MTSCFQPLRAFTRLNEPLIAAGIHSTMKEALGIEIVSALDGTSCPEADVVICDYESGMALAHHQKLRRTATARAPGVVVVTWRDSETEVRAALQAGIGGYLLYNCAAKELVEAVRVVARGSLYLCALAAARVAASLTRTPLTMRETEILLLIGEGMPNKLIAAQLNLALGTVKTHARAILDKLGASSRTHALVIAAQRGLLETPLPVRPAAAPRRPEIAAVPRHSASYREQLPA